MASTSAQVATAAKAASAKVHEMASIVHEYASKYSDAAPQGELLDAIKADLTTAADKLLEKQEDAGQESDVETYEVQVRAQASAALLLMATAVDKASTFDKEYELTKGLSQALHRAYARALGLLAQIQIHGKTIEGTLESSKARLATTASALNDALASIKTTPALSATAALLEQARDEVRASLAELEQAPLTEKPVVGGLQALALARKALAGASNVLASAKDSLANSAQVATVVQSATESVNKTRMQLFALLDRVTARATSLLADAEKYTVGAAVAVDQRFGVLDKAAALDAQFGVSTLASESVRQTIAKAQELDAQYGVVQRAQAAVEKLQALDATVTGGRVSPLVQSGIDLAVQGATSTLEYASGMQQRFVAAREGSLESEQGAVVETKGTE